MMRNVTNTSFGQLQQIDASLLNVGYAEAGPPDGRVVMLLHGWPYDIHSYVDRLWPLPRRSSMSTLDFSSASYRVTEQFSAFELLYHAAHLSWTNTKEN